MRSARRSTGALPIMPANAQHARSSQAASTTCRVSVLSILPLNVFLPDSDLLSAFLGRDDAGGGRQMLPHLAEEKLAQVHLRKLVRGLGVGSTHRHEPGREACGVDPVRHTGVGVGDDDHVIPSSSDSA
jgi:hypothetical protein